MFIAASQIVSTAYLGVSGNQVWRQADVYGQILGFLGSRGFAPFDSFANGGRDIFDVPVYQVTIALLSRITASDPLVVTRFFNLAAWALTAYAGYRLALALAGSIAATVFLFLLSTSPLILHYYSVPLPDVMAIALSLAGLAILHDGDSDGRAVALALPPLLIATIIKSPVPFIFLVFYVTLILFDTNNRKRLLPIATLLLVLLTTALATEILRQAAIGETQNKHYTLGWYFGTVIDRLRAEFWGYSVTRLNDSGPAQFAAIFLAISIGAVAIDRRRTVIAPLVAGTVAYFAGWLVFSNLYIRHDYYALPGIIVVFITTGVLVAALLKPLLASKKPRVSKIASFAVPLLLIPVAALVVLTQDSFGDRRRVSPFPAFEFALREQQEFLYVHDGLRNNPAMGGILSTKFIETTRDDFEANCADYLGRHTAVLVVGTSACLAANRSRADYYVADGGFMFFRRAP